MSLEFKTYRIEGVGKMIKDTKKKHIWKFNYIGQYYEIKAMESLMSGMLRIMVQDDKIFSSKISDDQKRRGLELEYTGLNLKFKKISDQIDLYINMNRFVPNSTIQLEKGPAFRIDPNNSRVKANAKPVTKKSNDQEVNMHMIEKSISESYLVYNKDFDDSDEDEGFDNFGEREKQSNRNSNNINNMGFNANIIQNKNAEPKVNMQFSFKKPGQTSINQSQQPISSRQNNQNQPNSFREDNPASTFGFNDSVSKGNDDFLSFDFGNPKPSTQQQKQSVQQRSNHTPMNFNWSIQSGVNPSNDPFGNSSDFKPVPSPKLNKVQSINNSASKSGFQKSPMEKNTAFNFNFIDNSQVNRSKDVFNSNPKTLSNQQPAQTVDLFDAFGAFNNAPQQSTQRSSNQGNKKFNNFGFGFDAKSDSINNPFEDFGFTPQQQNSFAQNQKPETQKGPMDSFSLHQTHWMEQPRVQPENFNIKTLQNMNSSTGNFNQPPLQSNPSQPAYEQKFQTALSQQTASPIKFPEPNIDNGFSHPIPADPFTNELANQSVKEHQVNLVLANESVDPFKNESQLNQWEQNKVQNHWNYQENQQTLYSDHEPNFKDYQDQSHNQADPFSNNGAINYNMESDQLNKDFDNMQINQNYDNFQNVNEAPADPFNGNYDNNAGQFNQNFGGQDQFDGNNAISNNIYDNNAFGNTGFDSNGFDNNGSHPGEKKAELNQLSNFSFRN